MLCVLIYNLRDRAMTCILRFEQFSHVESSRS